MLNAVGRSFLETFDYRFYAFAILLAVSFFCVWRRWRYKGWPTLDQCLNLGMSLAALVAGFSVLVVFIFTKPPAVEMLPAEAMILVGLIVPIVIFGHCWSRLRILIFPSRAPEPPRDGS
jgi:hypothetical protein